MTRSELEMLGLDNDKAFLAMQLIDGDKEIDHTDPDENWDDVLPKTCQYLRRCFHYPEKHVVVLHALSELLNGFGVETIWESDSSSPVIGEYVNMGDTYTPTVVYNTDSEEYEVTSWGDFLESWEHEQAEENGEIRCGYCGEMTKSDEEWSDTTCEHCHRNVSTGEHECVWGPIQHAHMTGNPHRKCKALGCNNITLDLYDDEELDD